MKFQKQTISDLQILFINNMATNDLLFRLEHYDSNNSNNVNIMIISIGAHIFLSNEFFNRNHCQ